MKHIAILLLMTFVMGCIFSVSEGLAVPLPPEMSLEKTGNSVEITWTPSAGADGYRLYYAAYPYTGPTSIGSVDVGNETEASYTLWEGASYYVAVTAYDETDESRYSNSELFLLGPYTTDHAEGTPELTIDTNALEVSTSWMEVTGATSYRLYYAPYPFIALNTIDTADMGDSTEADFTLWDGAAFYVAVTAVENGNESGYSNVELLLTGNPIPEWQHTSGSYTANGNGTVTDSSTGLTWQQSDDNHTRDWQASIDYCNALSLGGSSSWRSPTIDELFGLVDTSYFPNIDPIFNVTNPEWPHYWSSTSKPSYPDIGLRVDFGNGTVNDGNKTYGNYVRCVR